jgi:transposase
MGELGGLHRTARRLVHDFCPSVLPLPRSLGAIQKVIDRAAHAIVPPSEAIATLAHHAPGGSSDATPWSRHHPLQGLGALTPETVALSLMPPHRSKEAFVAVIDAWQGLLVSDGDGVYPDWGTRRQTGVAHLSRTARGVSEKRPAERAACGAGALKEVQRLCAMATAPPTGGAWRAWSARLCPWIDRSHARQDEVGRVARRWQREMASLGVFRCEQGVDATNNRAERAVRVGGRWRQGSHGSASDTGNRWGERPVSLRHTGRQRGQSTCGVLVDAVTSLFCGRQPALSWLYEKSPSSLPPVNAYNARLPT